MAKAYWRLSIHTVFLDNPTFRGMRWNLLKTYDKIYTIDLHGNSKKKEVCPDGSPDSNVFDIMQGVAITVFIKTGKKKANELGKVFHYDLYGKRDFKYDFLNRNSLKTIDYQELPNNAPNYFMVQKDFEAEGKYIEGFYIGDFFNSKVTGFQTHRDNFTTAESKEVLINRINELLDFEIEESQIVEKYNLKENKSWCLKNKRKEIDVINIEQNIFKCAYRPFEERYVSIDKAINDRPRTEIIKNYVGNKNITLLIPKQQSIVGFSHVFVSNYIASDCTLSSKSKEGNQLFPLYLYPDEGITELGIKRIPNLKKEIIEVIAKKLNLTFTNEKETTQNTFAPIDILDYIYAVLHSPAYREKYKEFLKIDFPRVPYPKDAKTFWQLVKLGGEIRQIHLLESPKVEQYISSYPIDGDNIITRKLTKTSIGYQATTDTHGKVWINDTQYFENVPLISWEFYIGGYQPAQKWLKDRKTRELKFEDILHYQKIIVALFETHRIMQEIDLIEVE